MSKDLKNKSSPPRWRFVVYTAGDNPVAERAKQILYMLCDRYAPDDYSIDIINVLDGKSELPPDLMAVPTVIRLSPAPERRVIGDLSEVAKAAHGLGFSGVGLA